MMTEQRRQELLELCEKATPGPWEVREKDHSCRVYPEGAGIDCICTLQVSNSPRFRQDRDFIAAARQALPELLAEVERLSKALEDRGPTVREAFALAGHPVPRKEDELVMEGTTGNWYASSRHGDWVFGIFEDKWEAYVGNIKYASIDLSDMPARSCLEALPQVVRDAIPADRQEGGA